MVVAGRTPVAVAPIPGAAAVVVRLLVAEEAVAEDQLPAAVDRVPAVGVARVPLVVGQGLPIAVAMHILS